jgi:membrane protein
MVRLTTSSLVRTAARSATGRFVLRVIRDLRSLMLVDRAMTLAAHAFTSVIPILIVLAAVRSRVDEASTPIFTEMGFDEHTADLLQASLPTGSQELRATGVVGLIILLIAATSVSRALERSLRKIWRTPPVRFRFAWRWAAATLITVVGVALVMAARLLLTGTAALVPVEFVVEVVLWAATWWTASWIAVNRRISLRQLLPGAALAGIGFAVAGRLGHAFLPPILADSASRFGILGVAFTYIGWLLVLASVLLVSAVIGRVAYVTYTRRVRAA